MGRSDVRRYAMEAVSSLELSGVIYPRCDTYAQGAAMAGAGAGAGSGAALAPGQHVPPGEASAVHVVRFTALQPYMPLVGPHQQRPPR